MRSTATFLVLAMLLIGTHDLCGQETGMDQQIESLKEKIDRLQAEITELKANKDPAKVSPAVAPDLAGANSVVEGGLQGGSPSSVPPATSLEALPGQLPIVESLPTYPPLEPVVPPLRMPSSRPVIDHRYDVPMVYPPAVTYYAQPVPGGVGYPSTATFQSPIVGGQVVGSVPPHYVDPRFRRPAPIYTPPLGPVFAPGGFGTPFIHGPAGNGIYIGQGGWGLDVGGLQMHFRGGHPGRGRGRGNGKGNGRRDD